MFSCRAPIVTSISRHASAAAPAPEATIFASAKLFASEFHRVDRGGGDDDRGAVLVVVEDRDLSCARAGRARPRNIPGP